MGWGEPSRPPGAGLARTPKATQAAPPPPPLAPDAVEPPRPWPDPDQAEPCPHDSLDCDGTHWHRIYSELWHAHDRLMHETRQAAELMMDEARPYHPDAIASLGRHLRTKVGDASVRRSTLPPPARG